MAQIVKMIDLAKSYVPGDPNAFPSNLQYTDREDSPEETLPIVAYEGYNFLPTSYGYRSYFGIDSTLDLEALPKPCDQIITFQSKTYENMLIAFCSDGIRTAKAGATVWTLSVPLTDEWLTNSIYMQYTWCVIENNLYIYRQGGAQVVKIADDHTITSFVPSFLNMAGQMGIFRGNGRLCFWDSENSISWSSAFDLTDFTPSIENMVGNATFLGVLGRIVMVLPHGEGYVIYCTRSIVGVSYSTTGTTVWDAMSITSSGGIAHPGACCIGQNDKEHYAYTSLGIITIGHYNALSRQYDLKPILPELFDYLKESRDPVYMQCHAARFLYISVIDDAYIVGITSFTNVSIPSLNAPIISIDTSLWDTYSALPYITPNETFQMLQSFLWAAKEVTNLDRNSRMYDAPTYCAIFALPNFPSQASDKGLFNVAEIWRKNSSPAMVDIDGLGIVTDIFEDLNVGYTSGDSSTVSDYRNATSKIVGAINVNGINVNSHISTNYYSGQSKTWTEEKSFAPKVYPEDITGIGTSAIDLLYNFISTVLEYEKFCADQYAGIIEEINLINNNNPHVRDYYTTEPNLTISSSQTADYAMIPKGGVSIALGMAHTAQNGFPTIRISAKIANHARIDSSICSRSLKAKVQVPVVECNPHYEVQFVEYWGQNPSAYATSLFLDHMPTMQEVADIMADPAYHITSTGQQYPATAGHKMQFVYDPNQIVPSGVAMYVTYVYAKDLTTGTLYNNYRLNVTCYKGKTSGFNPSQYIGVPQLNSARFDDNITGYVSMGYPYLSQAYETIFLYYSSINTWAYDMLRWMWHMCINSSEYNVTKKKYTAKSGIQYEFSNSHPVSYTVLPDKAVLLWAFIRLANTADAYTNQAVLVIPPYLMYKYTIEEELIYAAIPENANGYDSGSYGGADAEFTFQLVQTGVDTINEDMFGNAFVTPKSTIFVPTVTNPGEGIRLAFTPENWYDGGYWHIPTSIKHTVGDCIPWAMYDSAQDINYPTAKLVNGQHFMEHAAGTMLGISQPLGPILSLTDSGNACYPDLDADGWITSDPKFSYPPVTFTLQNGVPVPAYPTLVGSFVMDMHLKKWGKQAGEFSCLLQFSPINATNNESIPYTNFGMDSGILSPFDKKIKLFAQNDNNSIMRYGKIGLYRLGFTEMLEVNINFRTPYTGSIIVDGSVDANHINTEIQHKEDFVDVTQALVKCHVNARWHTISITGNFDLQYMEFRGIMAARR